MDRLPSDHRDDRCLDSTRGLRRHKPLLSAAGGGGSSASNGQQPMLELPVGVEIGGASRMDDAAVIDDVGPVCDA